MRRWVVAAWLGCACAPAPLAEPEVTVRPQAPPSARPAPSPVPAPAPAAGAPCPDDMVLVDTRFCRDTSQHKVGLHCLETEEDVWTPAPAFDRPIDRGWPAR